MSYSGHLNGSPYLSGIEQAGLGRSNNAPLSLRSLASPRSFNPTNMSSAAMRPVSPFSFDRSSSYGSTHASSSVESNNLALRCSSFGNNGSASPVGILGQNGIHPILTGSSAGADPSHAGSPLFNHPSAYASLASASKGLSGVGGFGRSSTSGSSRAGSFTSITGSGNLAAFAGASGGLYAANLPGFGERMRTASDHSRQSSGGYASNLSAPHGAGPGSNSSGNTHSSHSPLPQTSSSLSLPQSYAPRPHDLPEDPIDAAIALATSCASAGYSSRYSPYGLVSPPHSQARKLSASASFRSSSLSVLQSSTPPSLPRQSISDSSPPSSVLQPEASRNGSFSGQYSGLNSPIGSQTGSTGNRAPPSTGPLSASDPRVQLLVSNLPYRVRWQDLKDLFRKTGTVLRADVSLNPDNRSRGYGTVLMATEEDAFKATGMLGGFTWQGRTLEVRMDRSGALVGVAGSAVTFGPNAVGGETPPAVGQGFGNLRGAGVGAGSIGGGNSGYLNIPHMGSHSGDILSPSLSSASSLTASQGSLPGARSSSFSSVDSGNAATGHDGLSDFERGFMQGQMRIVTALQQPGQGVGSPQPSTSLYSLAGASGGGQQQGGIGCNVGGDASALAGQAGFNGANDPTATASYVPSSGGSSVPTGMPGVAAIASWPAGPGMGGPNVQAQPFGTGYGLGQSLPANTGTTSYAGRVLFVGNLPFHCQWQDLKDLFRAAGNIQRADVAIGPEGRSRGFGTVLFTSQEDAQNAVRLYHGYEYSGRTLKVHFDRFAAQNGPAVGTPGAPSQYTGAFAAAQPLSHVNHSNRMSRYPSQAHQHSSHVQMAHQQQLHQHQPQFNYGQFNVQAAADTMGGMQSQSFSALGPAMSSNSHVQGLQRWKDELSQAGQSMGAFGGNAAAYQTHYQQLQQRQHDQQYQQLAQAQSAQQQQGQYNQYAQPGLDRQDLYSQQQSAVQQSRKHDSMSISLTNQGGLNGPLAYLPSDLMSPGLTSPPAPMAAPAGGAPHSGRIQLPPMGFSNVTGADMSPMNPRMSVPMTPGMPGFTFQVVPQMPPLHPQFLSPGLGPFSPPLGDPNAMPSGANNANAGFPRFINPAPGAPLQAANMTTPEAPAGYNPMFPMSGVHGNNGQVQMQPYAQGAMDQSLQQQYHQQPATPHWSQSYQPQRGSQRDTISSQVEDVNDSARGADYRSDQDRRSDIAKTPGAGPRRPPDAGLVRRASDGTPSAITPPAADGYPFPMVVAPTWALFARRASTNSPASSLLPHGPGPADEGDAELAASVSNNALASQSAEELAKTIARLSVKGAALAKDANAKRSLSMTAERSAAANAMARLREKAGTPTLSGRALSPSQSESGQAGDDSANGLGVPFTSSEGPKGSLSAKLRLGLNNPGKPSPLSNSQLASLNPGSSAGPSTPVGNASQSQTVSLAFRAARESLLGVSVPSSVLEAASSGSALDTSSTPEGSLKSTPAEESGPSDETLGKRPAGTHLPTLSHHDVHSPTCRIGSIYLNGPA